MTVSFRCKSVTTASLVVEKTLIFTAHITQQSPIIGFFFDLHLFVFYIQILFLRLLSLVFPRPKQCKTTELIK